MFGHLSGEDHVNNLLPNCAEILPEINSLAIISLPVWKAYTS